MSKNAVHYIQGGMTDKVRDFVVERFISSGKDSTVKEIALGLGISESTVRKVFKAQGGTIRGLRYERESRESHSRNVPNINIGAHYVGAWGPSCELLAEIIKELRQ
jgi:predicted transcriptional regulator